MSQFPPERFLPERARIDQLRHEVSNPLTIIRGHVHLLHLRLERADTLDAQAVPTILAQLATIDAAVTRAVAAIDAFELATGERSDAETPPP